MNVGHVDLEKAYTRLYGRRVDGRRIHESTPGGNWKILTILAAMRLGGINAAMTIDEATDADIFLAYVEQVLCPTLGIGSFASVLRLTPFSPGL